VLGHQKILVMPADEQILMLLADKETNLDLFDEQIRPL
jgi:hypothetical protein